jgi:uncharacterized protein YoxC
MLEDSIMMIAAVITAIGIIIGALIAIYRVAKKIGDSIGVDKHGRTLAERLDRVEHQLWENGGSSLADRVNNIDKSVTSLNAEIKLITAIVTASVGHSARFQEIKAKKDTSKKDRIAT